jgi:hypothetical protein
MLQFPQSCILIPIIQLGETFMIVPLSLNETCNDVHVDNN